MKTTTCSTIIALLTIINLASCSEEKNTPSGPSQEKLQGTWTITASAGTEWEQGEGIITPKADDEETLNATFVFAGGSFTATAEGGSSFGTFDFTIDGNTITVDGIGVFTIKNFVAGTSMDWEQREPLESDYEEKDPGQFLYYQKFWTFEK